MTEKDMKKMRRSELLEVISVMQKELDELKGETKAPAAAELAAEQKIKEYRRRTAAAAITYIIAAAAIVVLISVFFLPVYRVTGRSMAPTLESGNIILCGRYSRCSRGDIVAADLGGKVLIKRIIAVSGDVISIDADGSVTLNGSPLDEPYISEKALGECDIEFPYTVPENRYFVMGDNREVSVDSRSMTVGCIADEFIVGKIVFRLSPFGKVR